MSESKPIRLAAPLAWFQPDPTNTQQASVDPDGRVSGYLVTWAPGIVGTLPASGFVQPGVTDYTRMHRIDGRTSDGASIQVGRLEAEDGSTVGHAVVGEDTHGVWIAGALDPAVVGEYAGGEHMLSGEWRRGGGRVSFAAVMIARSSGGFPVKAALR